MFKVLERVTGFEVLRDLSDFIESFGGMYKGFRDRAAKVETMLRDPASSFLLVTSPNPLTVDEAIFFHGKLLEYKMPFAGFVVNRVHPDTLGAWGANLPILFAGAVRETSIVALSSNEIVIVYREAGSPFAVQAVYATVAGTTVTVSPPDLVVAAS